MRVNRYIFLVCVLASLAAQGDVVRLKNGNHLEGIIRAETATSYQLDIGFGTIAIAKDRVASVERASAADQTRLEAERRQKYILHEKYAPQDQLDLLKEFQALEDQHAEAVRQQARLRELQIAFDRDQVELRQLAAQESQLADQLSVLPHATPADAELYNQRVAAINSVRTRMNELARKPGEYLEAMTRCRQDLARFTTALFTFSDRFQPRKAQQKQDNATAEFFHALEERLTTFIAETRQIRLPFQPDQRHVIVKARLNDEVEGNFIVDTGATSVSLSQDMAQRLKLDGHGHEVLVTMADGSTRKVNMALLRSIEVQGARVEHLTTLIMPDSPHDAVDGLLGMNFLLEFNIRLDPTTHTLILSRFAPP